jgi:head-tail adaptor
MPHAGELRERVALLQRSLDGDGNRLGDWVEEFSRAAKVHRLRGGEEVLAGRLAGKKPTLITVRADSQTKAVTSDWRVEHLQTGEVYVVKDASISDDRAWIDILVEAAPGR